MAINEEPVMSIVHRLLPSAFGYQRRTNFITHQNHSQAESSVQSIGSTDRLTCAPWLGLYFEDSELG